MEQAAKLLCINAINTDERLFHCGKPTGKYEEKSHGFLKVGMKMVDFYSDQSIKMCIDGVR